MFKPLKSTINFPTPINISYWWNFGSLLIMFLMIQIISGFMLSMHYTPHMLLAFPSIIHIMQNMNFGWLMHNMHTNGASLYFLFLYLHISRGIYYQSFKLTYTWLIGSTLLIMSMITAFLGYVLPWGQMSFWGATVITNLISTIPFIGTNIVEWVWGGFSINNATLNRFFSFHFILPFIIFMMMMIHIFFLHLSGSTNPLGTNSNLNKIPFNYYFTVKDFLGFSIIIFLMTIITLQYPYLLCDPDNFSPSNPMITPIHIQPEWYFLFAYAILRSIPNKLGGIIALIFSILIFFFLPSMKMTSMNSLQFYPINQHLYWSFINTFILLTWLGMQPIEYPFMMTAQITSVIYFSFFFFNALMLYLWKLIILT